MKGEDFYPSPCIWAMMFAMTMTMTMKMMKTFICLGVFGRLLRCHRGEVKPGHLLLAHLLVAMTIYLFHYGFRYGRGNMPSLRGQTFHLDLMVSVWE